MQKRHCSLTLIIALAACLFSSKSEAQKSFELGLNTTSVLQNTIGLNSNSEEIIEPYSLMMRWGNDSGAIRFGLGGGVSTNNNQPFSSGTLSTEAKSFHLALGYEWRRQITPRLRYYFGVEGIYSYTRDFSDFQFITGSFFHTATTENQSSTYMLSPFFGLQFQVNDWLGIATKSRMEFLMKEKREESVDESTGTVIGPITSTDYNVRHILPNSIYLYFNISGLKNTKLNR